MIVTDIETLSEKVHERIIRQSIPMMTDEEVSYVLSDCPEVNPFRYESWRYMIRDKYPNVNPDKFYKWIAREALKSDNSNFFVTVSRFYLFGENDEINNNTFLSDYAYLRLLDQINALRWLS